MLTDRNRKPAVASLMQIARSYSTGLMVRSRIITAFFERHMGGVCIAWLVVTIGLAAVHLAFPASPIHNLRDAAPVLLAYTLVIVAPIMGYLVARHAFAAQATQTQPRYRFAILGHWRHLSADDARGKAAFGPVGFMASLLVGMILNVVIRTFEFFTAVPAMSYHAPAWGQTLFTFMALDVVVTGFFYMVAFVMALRSVPLFPRMLLFAWVIDVTMQLIIADQMAAVGGVPQSVVQPLLTLISGNITKVAISAVVWLPYLMLSERVNVTYRHRTDARLPL